VPDSFQRSVRVAGLGVIAPVTFTEAASSGLDWFAALGSGSQPESLADAARNASEQEDIENGVARAWEYGDAVVTVHEQVVDITDHSRVEAAFAASRLRIAGLPLNDASTPPADAGAAGRQVTVGMHILEAVDAPASCRLRPTLSRSLPPPGGGNGSAAALGGAGDAWPTRHRGERPSPGSRELAGDVCRGDLASGATAVAGVPARLTGRAECDGHAVGRRLQADADPEHRIGRGDDGRVPESVLEQVSPLMADDPRADSEAATSTWTGFM
jgi:hypothetical protein